MSAETPASAKAMLTAVASRAAREPLLQFLAAGLVLFWANGLLHGDEQRAPADSIVISKGRVQQIADSYRLLSGRMPSQTELQALVDDYIDEEVYYREAVAMGLDADDTIVRRRMRQKLEFISEDANASEEPTEEQLAARLASHADEYRLPARVSFRQVLASADARGARAEADAVAFLEALKSGAAPETTGDASMLPSAMPLTTQQGVASLFGDAFAAALFAHAGDGWFGPVASPFGAHDVLIVSREAAREPSLEEVRVKLRADWIEARRRAKREEFRALLRERYEVSIDWPDLYAQTAGHAAAGAAGAE